MQTDLLQLKTKKYKKNPTSEKYSDKTLRCCSNVFRRDNDNSYSFHRYYCNKTISLGGKLELNEVFAWHFQRT